ncbi:transposase, partial [Staphylococcus shinii]|uniref:transposase n=1 Tax=Staphylococcus shinii TaxID=2912228 RepID=UPI003B969820
MKSFRNQKQKESAIKEKIDIKHVFGFMKAILGYTRMSVQGINKVKIALGIVLMALNIRKVVVT